MPFKLLASLVLLVSAAVASAADKDAWYAKAVKSVEATFDPAEAKPGQTVTFKLTVTLNDGYHTYPMKQTDPNAKGMVNKLTFPKPGGVIFVGDATDPEGYDTKPEPDLNIAELRTYHNSVTFERKAVVSPKAVAGEAAIKLDAFELNVCDKLNCFPAKTLTPAAKLKVLDGRVEVEKTYAAEVKKALDGK